MSSLVQAILLSAGESRKSGPPGEIVSLHVGDKERVVLEGPETAQFLLDGQVQLAVRRRGLALSPVELGGPLVFGARRLELIDGVSKFRFDVLTEASALSVKRLLPAVRVVERWFPRIHGGFWYLDVLGTPRRLVDHMRLLAFVLDFVGEIERGVLEIEAFPALRHTSVRRIQPFGYPVDVVATTSLLARNPDLLEQSVNGPFVVGSTRYGPRLVAIRVPRADHASMENRRLVAFLQALAQECRRAEECGLLIEELEAVSKARRRIQALLGNTFLSAVAACDLPHPDDPPIGLETNHRWYSRLRQLRVEFQRDAVYGDAVTPHRKHVATADRVFQAWCCNAVARALGLTPCGPFRGGKAPVFRSAEWELLYDGPVLHSWRDASSRPDDYRPDIVLRRRDNPQRVIVLDVKYAVSEGAEVPAGRLKEVQAYMHAFGLRKLGVVHPMASDPASLAVRRIEGRGILLMEVALLPSMCEVEHGNCLEALRKALLELECSEGEAFSPVVSSVPSAQALPGGGA